MRTLYLITLGGGQYGIWKDDVRSVREVQTVHRLPLSPACIAGISMLDGRSTALADLGVCLGLPRRELSEKGRVLFVSGKGEDTGFVVPGAPEEADVPAEGVLPMPGFVKTDILSSCAVSGRRAIPLIDLAGLYDRIHAHSSEPSVPALTFSSSPRSGTSGRGGVRLIKAGGELFAVPFEDASNSSVQPGDISPLPLLPRAVKGVAVHHGALLAVASLAEKMGLPDPGREDAIMVAERAGGRLGLLINEDRGTLPAEEAPVAALPPVTATGWTTAAVLHQGDVIPLVDCFALFGTGDRDEALKRLPEQYHPDSPFPELFGRTSVEVLEFSLLGVRHALPRAEVEDIVPFRPCRKVPGSLPIAVGVISHEGKVLPVLDLAMVFGRRSLETSGWSMVLVRNGDFRALVLTEAVYEERTVPVSVQRKVPILLPHNLVYGCYPEGVAVRLILNVFALAVHFDKAMVKDLLPALTREMAEAPAELVPSLLPDEHVKSSSALPASSILKAGAGALQQARQAEEAAVRAAEEERAIREAEERIRAEAEERDRAEAVEQARREAEGRARREAEEQARREAETRAREEAAEARARREAEELARAKAAVRAEAEAKARAEEAERERRQMEERARVEAEARARREEEGRALREAEERVRRAAEEQARRDAEEQARRAEEEARAAEERGRLEREKRARQEAEASVREAEEIKRRREPAPLPPGAGTAVPAGSPRVSSSPSPREDQQHKLGELKWYAWAGVVVLLVAIFVYFGVTREHREVPNKGRAGTTEVRPDGTAKIAAPSASPERPAPKGPLVLTVPAESKIETDVYIVKKGDTLWDICERFTGDPFNYPRIAGDNRIADPDLIFPGQKILLKR